MLWSLFYLRTMWTTRAVYTLVMQRINFELHKYSIRILWTNHLIPWGALEAFFSINCAKLTWSPLHSHSYYIFPRPAPASPKFQHIDHSFQMFQVKHATYLQIGNWRSKYFWFWISKIMFCQRGSEIIFFSSRVSRAIWISCPLRGSFPCRWGAVLDQHLALDPCNWLINVFWTCRWAQDWLSRSRHLQHQDRITNTHNEGIITIHSDRANNANRKTHNVILMFNMIFAFAFIDTTREQVLRIAAKTKDMSWMLLLRKVRNSDIYIQ